MVFIIDLIIDDMPKIKPTNAPTNGPSTIAPIITGMCKVVAFKIPSGINPNGVNPKATVIAPKIDVIISFLFLSYCLFYSFFLLIEFC